MAIGRNLCLRTLRLLLVPLAGISRLQEMLGRQLAPRRWPLTGRCLRCGRCCELLAVGLPAWMWRHPRLRALVRGYYEVNYGFIHEGDRDDRCLVFRCSNLGSDRLCRIYPRRPRLCREYPSAWGPEPPDLYPECGFRLAGPEGSPPDARDDMQAPEGRPTDLSAPRQAGRRIND